MTRHPLDGNAIAADLHYGQDRDDECSRCKRNPPDHPRFADLCESCGDDVEDER